MNALPLLTLETYVLLGAYLSGRMEAKEIAQETLPHHMILVALRAGALALAIGTVLSSEVSLPDLLWLSVMAMGTFGPGHRITLNMTRARKYGHRIPWYHLSGRGYDKWTGLLWMYITKALKRPQWNTMKTHFGAVTMTEASIAIIALIHLKTTTP
jgi:hypothetical protein